MCLLQSYTTLNLTTILIHTAKSTDAHHREPRSRLCGRHLVPVLLCWLTKERVKGIIDSSKLSSNTSYPISFLSTLPPNYTELRRQYIRAYAFTGFCRLRNYIAIQYKTQLLHDRLFETFPQNKLWRSKPKPNRRNGRNICLFHNTHQLATQNTKEDDLSSNQNTFFLRTGLDNGHSAIIGLGLDRFEFR